MDPSSAPWTLPYHQHRSGTPSHTIRALPGPFPAFNITPGPFPPLPCHQCLSCVSEVMPLANLILPFHTIPIPLMPPEDLLHCQRALKTFSQDQYPLMGLAPLVIILCTLSAPYRCFLLEHSTLPSPPAPLQDPFTLPMSPSSDPFIPPMYPSTLVPLANLFAPLMPPLTSIKNPFTVPTTHHLCTCHFAHCCSHTLPLLSTFAEDPISSSPHCSLNISRYEDLFRTRSH